MCIRDSPWADSATLDSAALSSAPHALSIHASEQWRRVASAVLSAQRRHAPQLQARHGCGRCAGLEGRVEELRRANLVLAAALRERDELDRTMQRLVLEELAIEAVLGEASSMRAGQRGEEAHGGAVSAHELLRAREEILRLKNQVVRSRSVAARPHLPARHTPGEPAAAVSGGEQHKEKEEEEPVSSHVPVDPEAIVLRRLQDPSGAREYDEQHGEGAARRLLRDMTWRRCVMHNT
eukprot:TRINITY_DN50792_c0_g1_i2.p1 TRINITY_DN50792_c0_g1~~TRINITY_DN50792_c0_g1_i2.p1  ORF type:complete len:237 (-),score=65.29 TRINITY_DN50792_c0_g1_i2:204-914(-)